MLSLQADSIVERLIELSVERRGEPPVPWAWLTLGSTARRELTLGSDQENALAFAAGPADAEVDGYFEALVRTSSTG